jgi:hypothetical protein
VPLQTLIADAHRFLLAATLTPLLDPDDWHELEALQPVMASADSKHVVDMEDARQSSSNEHRTPSPVDPEKRASLPTASKSAQRILAHSHDADEAMKAFEAGEVIEIDEATNKRLLRIIDWHLLPLLCVVYGLNYLDKTTLSYASIMGIKKDIGLVGDDYQWLGQVERPVAQTSPREIG